MINTVYILISFRVAIMNFFLYIPAVDILEILALAELAFAAAAAAVEDTYAVADVGVGLHNWYKLNKNTNGLVTNALMLLKLLSNQILF